MVVMPKGEAEQGVDADLARLPKHMQAGTLAANARKAARRIDAGLSARDFAAISRELRVTMAKLAENAPVENTGDVGDELEARREARMKAAGGS